MEGRFLVELLEPFELALLANEHTVIATTNFALYLSILSGYLVVAYLAGSRLKRPQILLMNSIFSISAIYFALSYFANIAESTNYALQLPRPGVFVIGRNLFLAFAAIVFIGMCIAIPFSIRFLREIRKNEN